VGVVGGVEVKHLVESLHPELVVAEEEPLLVLKQHDDLQTDSHNLELEKKQVYEDQVEVVEVHDPFADLATVVVVEELLFQLVLEAMGVEQAETSQISTKEFYQPEDEMPVKMVAREVEAALMMTLLLPQLANRCIHHTSVLP